MTNRFKCLVLSVLLLAVAAPAFSETSDKWGLLQNEPGAFEGYTLFAPLKQPTVYLIDIEGRVVHRWDNGLRPGNSVYLLPDGRLLRATHVDDNPVFGKPDFGGGRIQILNWEGAVEWDYKISTETRYQHHDITPMPNGNVLALVWEYRSAEEAIAAGRIPENIADGKLFPDTVLEVKPTGATSGEIVWEWKLWDHLVQDHDKSKDNYGLVADHPELLDINCVARAAPDWNHGNGIAYNVQLDQIIIDFRAMNEFYVIDHSTTTAEAAGHSGGRQGKGGDFLYRWGNAAMYGRGDETDRTLFLQHHPHWIPAGLAGAGNILLFNNGTGRPDENYSSVEEIIPPTSASGGYRIETGKPFGPRKPVWSYQSDPTSNFYSHFISGSQRLPNGNTLICSGAWSRFFEVTPEGEIVWEYRSAYGRPDAPKSQGGTLEAAAAPPVGRALRGIGVFRALRYAPDYPGLAGKQLTPIQ
jgi:hypothetical protein